MSGISFHLVNREAVAVGKIWAERLIKSGGSDITKVGDDGIARRVFDPWLANSTIADRERIAEIITSSIKTGELLKSVAKKLNKISAIQNHDVNLIVFQETRFLLYSGTMQRFRNEGIQECIWHTIDKQEKEHFELDGKTFDLDDPIWNRMYEMKCKCWCEPLTRY